MEKKEIAVLNHWLLHLKKNNVIINTYDMEDRK